MRMFTAHGFSFLRPILKELLEKQSCGFEGVDKRSLVSDGRRSKVSYIETHGVRAYAKLYVDQWPRKLHSLLRRSRADREFGAMRLLDSQVENPIKPLAWGEKRRFGVIESSVLITRAWDSSHDLRALRRKWQRGDMDADELESLAQGFAGVLAQLAQIHEDGTYLGDGYDKNLLLRIQPNQRLEWAWIDQPHLSFYGKPLSWRLRIQELARLDKCLHGFFPVQAREEAWDRYFNGLLSPEQKANLMVRVAALREQMKSPSLYRRFTVFRRHFSEAILTNPLTQS
ncbi:MAG: lipopolysaccharide kinase InaA family protein [Planctomycetota bacterium]|nr:lipopolysaccharide kinase InaA family protein [Planctomycetota bacterium]